MLTRKIFAIIGLFLAFLLIGEFNASAQTVKPEAVYYQPARLKLRGIGEFNPKRNPETNYNGIMTELFYPIGWSKDGKFAYYVEPPDQACGCYFGHFIIQDLKTDKILWEDDYAGDSEGLPDTEETMADHWKNREKLFSEKLTEYGIKQQTQFKLQFPSLRYEKDVLTPKLEIKLKTDGVFEVDGTVKLFMTSKSRGKKMLYEKRYFKKDTNGLRSIEVSGALLSPFEARAAIIVVEENRGYEGPPNVTSIKIVGSTLTTGFAKN